MIHRIIPRIDSRTVTNSSNFSKKLANLVPAKLGKDDIAIRIIMNKFPAPNAITMYRKCSNINELIIISYLLTSISGFFETVK